MLFAVDLITLASRIKMISLVNFSEISRCLPPVCTIFYQTERRNPIRGSGFKTEQYVGNLEHAQTIWLTCVCVLCSVIISARIFLQRIGSKQRSLASIFDLICQFLNGETYLRSTGVKVFQGGELFSSPVPFPYSICPREPSSFPGPKFQ